MKQILLTLTMMFTLLTSANAMSYEQAREQALFLTDKMAYELNLTEEQYEAAYEINLDYLMGVNTAADVYAEYWTRRNLDFTYILLDWQYRLFCDAAYFYRPIWWADGFWHFGIYARYPHRTYLYFGHPHFYITYRGGHSWHMNGGRSWYHTNNFIVVNNIRTHNHTNGMRDHWDRGGYHNNKDGVGNRGNHGDRNNGTGNYGNRGDRNNGTIGSNTGNRGDRNNGTGNYGNRGDRNNGTIGSNTGNRGDRNTGTTGTSSGGFNYGGHRGNDGSSRYSRPSSTRETVSGASGDGVAVPSNPGSSSSYRPSSTSSITVSRPSTSSPTNSSASQRGSFSRSEATSSPRSFGSSATSSPRSFGSSSTSSPRSFGSSSSSASQRVNVGGGTRGSLGGGSHSGSFSGGGSRGSFGGGSHSGGGAHNGGGHRGR